MKKTEIQFSVSQMSPDRALVEKVVDEEIEAFNHWFQQLGNAPIVRSERAILKTFLAYKLGLAKGPEAPKGPPDDSA